MNFCVSALYTCLCVCVQVCVCMWEAEGFTGYHPQLFFTFFSTLFVLSIMCMRCPRKPEEGIGPLELALERALAVIVGAGSRAASAPTF